MTETEIEKLLELQKAAFETIWWLNERVEHEPDVLRDENIEKWRHADSCETWVRAVRGMLPPHLRPDEGDVPAFARLFSAFFSTSFRVVENAPVRGYGYWGDPEGFVPGPRRRIMSGAPTGKKSRKGKEKVRDVAHELRLNALEELAIENDVDASRAALESVESSGARQEDVTLWAYVRELQRRSQFASQGEAVYQLWQNLSEAQHKNLKAKQVVAARERLSAAVQLAAKTHP